jgi:hypothetical protein
MKLNSLLPHQGTVTLIRLTFTTHTGSWNTASHAQPLANTWLHERYTAMVSMRTICFNCQEPSVISYIFRTRNYKCFHEDREHVR